MKVKLACNMVLCEGCQKTMSSAGPILFCATPGCAYNGRAYEAPTLDIKEVEAPKK